MRIKLFLIFPPLGQSITQLKHFEVKEEKKGEVTVVFISYITRSAIY